MVSSDSLTGFSHLSRIFSFQRFKARFQNNRLLNNLTHLTHALSLFSVDFWEDIVLTLLCCEQINVGAHDVERIVAIVSSLAPNGQSYLHGTPLLYIVTAHALLSPVWGFFDAGSLAYSYRQQRHNAK